MFAGRLTMSFGYMQVLHVILAGKGQKNFEIYQRKQYLKAQLDCIKTYRTLCSQGKTSKYFLQNFLRMTYLLATSIFVF